MYKVLMYVFAMDPTVDFGAPPSKAYAARDRVDYNKTCLHKHIIQMDNEDNKVDWKEKRKGNEKVKRHSK